MIPSQQTIYCNCLHDSIQMQCHVIKTMTGIPERLLTLVSDSLWNFSHPVMEHTFVPYSLDLNCWNFFNKWLK